jgi:hypothetical protein
MSLIWEISSALNISVTNLIRKNVRKSPKCSVTQKD